MESKVDAVSHPRNGVKIGGVWFDAKAEGVQKALRGVNKGDTVEYSTKEKELTFIKVKEKASGDEPKDAHYGEKQTDLSKIPGKVPEDLDLDKMMQESIDTVMGKALERNDNGTMKIPESLVGQMEWGKLIITLFIGKTRQA